MALAHHFFSGANRVNTYRWLARVTAQGKPIVDSVQLMYSHASDDGEHPRRVRAQALAAWSEGLLSGQTFGSAVVGWVPASHRMILEAGERAKRLPQAFEVCAWLDESSSSMRRAVISALSAPLGVLALVFGIYAFFGLEVFPEFENIVPMEEWEGIASYMPMMYGYVLDGGLALTVVAFVAFFIVMFFFVLPRWTSPWRTYLEPWLPFRIYRMFASCFFLIGLTGLLRAKVSMDDALVLLQEGQTPWVRSRLHMVKTELLAGRSAGDAFWYADRHFPSIEINRELRIVFSFTSYEEVVYDLARRWVDASVEQIQALAGRTRFLAQAVNGLLMAALVFSLMQISSQVQV